MFDEIWTRKLEMFEPETQNRTKELKFQAHHTYHSS